MISSHYFQRLQSSSRRTEHRMYNLKEITSSTKQAATNEYLLSGEHLIRRLHPWQCVMSQDHLHSSILQPVQTTALIANENSTLVLELQTQLLTK
jgi:hypothetical protein